jgi:hypothetical protein
MNHFYERQNPLNNISESEFNEKLDQIASTFGENWLETESEHPLQKLWNRRDYLATNELYILGNALLELKKIDNKWVNSQVKHILGRDENNRRGAFFELIGMSYLLNENVQLIPSAACQPGIDGCLQFSDNYKINFSLKRYGLSTHHRTFLEESNKVEKIIVEELENSSSNTIQVYIASVDKLPNSSDWHLLKIRISDIVKNFKSAPIEFKLENKSWSIKVRPLINYNSIYHETKKSYTCIIASPFHKNEKENLFSKLDDACINLAKHSSQNSKPCNFIYIHLPVTASVKSCCNWAKEYFDNFPNKPLAGIIFYQPSSVNSRGSTLINHYIGLETSRKFEVWQGGNANHIIKLNFPVGICSETSPVLVYHTGNRTQVLDNCYVFQSGNHYLKMVEREDGTYQRSLIELPSGIHMHTICKPPNSQHEIQISGVFPPTDELLIV